MKRNEKKLKKNKNKKKNISNKKHIDNITSLFLFIFTN